MMFPIFVLARLIPSLTSIQNGPNTTSPTAITHVVDFVRTIAEDRFGRTEVRAIGDGKPRRYPSRDVQGREAYLIGDRVVWVNPKSGLVTGAYGLGTHGIDRPGRPKIDSKGRPGLYSVRRNVSDEGAKELAQKFYAATGRPFGIEIDDISRGSGGNGDDLGVNFVPTDHGVPYTDQYGGYMDIDQETGRLDFLLLHREPPTPPERLIPGISAEDAHLIALRAAAQSGVPVKDSPVPHSNLAISGLDPVPDSTASYTYTSADRDDAVAGRGRLVYDVRLNGTRPGTTTLYTILIDARDGRLLEVHRQGLHALGGSGTSKPLPESFAPPSDRHSWRVSEGDKPWSAPVFVALCPASSEGFSPTRKILLTDGKVAFSASYDPTSGRIGIDDGKGGTQTYAVGAALTDRLRVKGL